MSYHANPTRISTRARVLEAVRWYFRATGMSPSFSEIGLRAGVPKQRVGRYLDELQRDEYLTYEKGEARSIMLADPGANISDADLLSAALGRGWVVKMPTPAAAAVGEATPVELAMPDWASDLLRKV